VAVPEERRDAVLPRDPTRMSGGISFDPSREWLGIDAVDLADPLRVLGLAADVSDPDLVTAAAARLLEKLQHVDPGPFKRAHESLVRRIEACRDEALATVAARATRLVPPPVPASLAPPAVTPAGPGRTVPPPLKAETTTADAPVPAAEPDVIHVQRSAVVRRKSPSALPALLSLLALVAVGGVALKLWPQRGPKTASGVPQVAVAIPRPQPPTPAPPRPPVVTPATEPPAARTTTPSASPNPGTSSPPKIGDSPPVSPTPQPPPAPPAPQQPDPEARARAVAGVDQSLRAAYEAIRADEFDTADRQVAAAARLAADHDDLADRVTCWRQFARYARQAAGYREKALNAANAGGDYNVGNRRIAVVESTPQRFVYHAAGRNVPISPRADVPGPIVTAILRAWFAADGRPGNHVFLGTHLLARREPNTRLAAAEWNRARERGEDVSNLEPLLKDPIIQEAAAE
jgi:hypothetical protein